MNNGMMMVAMAAGAVMLGAWFFSRQNAAALPAPQQQRLSDAGQQPNFMSEDENDGSGGDWGARRPPSGANFGGDQWLGEG